MPAASEAAARRYADAVFDLAQEENRLDDWEQQLVRLSDLFSGVGVTTWLANPSIPMTDKEALIDTGLADVGAEVRNLGRLLVTRGRADLAVQILSIYKERLDRARGIVHARVTTAVPLSAEEEAAVRERLLRMTGQQVSIETAVDPAIIGGIIVRIGDQLIDGSARARLQQLKRRLAGTAR